MQPHYDTDAPHRVLVMMLTDELDGRTQSTLMARCAGDAEVRAVASADDRLDALRAALAPRGIPMESALGDHDPTQAAEHEIAQFNPDELIVVMHAIGEEEAEERHLSAKLRGRFLMPMTFIRTKPQGVISAD
jgi:hypothetical protein